MAGVGDRLVSARPTGLGAPVRPGSPRPPAGRLVRALLADPSPVFRRGLLGILGHEPDLRVVAEVGSSDEAVAATRSLAPDIVLVDAGLATDNQWSDVRRLLPKLRMCLLIPVGPADPSLSTTLRGLPTDADGYLAKNLSVDELAPALRTIFTGRPVLSPSLAVSLLPSLQSWANGDVAERSTPSVPAEAHSLTEREMEVLRLLAEGLPNRSVAARLFISENTVRNHVRHILDKLHLRSRTEAALYAVRTGVIELPSAGAHRG